MIFDHEKRKKTIGASEIAAILGLSVPAVKTRLHRARNKIRQRLEPYYRGWLRREEL